jgi:arylsulfatase A-like enzyme
MARRFSPRTPPAAGAVAGAATGLALVAAEIATSLLVGAPLPFRAGAFLAAYCVPGLAIAGALAGLFLTIGRATAALVWMTGAACAAAVVSQDLMSGRPRLAPLRVAALLAAAVAAAAGAWASERALARRSVPRVPGLVLRMALLPPMVAVVHLGALALERAPSWAALALPAAVAAAGVLGTMVLAPPAARAGALSSAGLAAGVAVAATVAAGTAAGRPAPGALRDDAQPAATQASSGLPSFVLIVLDTVRASNLSCYGYHRRTTPRLDAFATGAVRFTAASTVSPWSVPAHASLFTGLFAPEHGAGASPPGTNLPLPRSAPLDPRFVTLAEGLAERGYATAGISANVLVAPPMQLTQGFRHYDVRRSPRALTPRYRTLLQRGQGLLPRAVLADPMMAAFPSVFRSAEEVTEAAAAWLARRPAGQPYFLFLNYMDAHTPFVHREGFSGRWPGRSPRLPPYGLSDIEGVMARRRTISAEEAAHIRALYDDALGYLDHHVGRLLETLDAQPDRERTWIVVTADHGEALGEHQRLGHDCVLYEQVLHVPLIIRFPAAAGEASRHGQADDGAVQITDLAPMILAAAGGPAPRDSPSRQGAKVASVECLCWHDHARFHGPAGQALARGGLKYLHEQGRAPALFDLVADPLETNDLAAARPEDAQRLRLELERWRASLAAPPAGAPAAGEAEREEALRALGYVK